MGHFSAVNFFRKKRDSLLNDAGIKTFQRFSLEVDAESNLWVVGCREIKEYSDTYILFDCTDRLIRVTGVNMTIKVFSPVETAVQGKIESVSFL